MFRTNEYRVKYVWVGAEMFYEYDAKKQALKDVTDSKQNYMYTVS